MAVRNYRDLVAWQKAMEFVEAVYLLSRDFPPDERFALTNQLRRAATSVPSNIAEGEGRFSKPDFNRFLSMALGSLREAETQIEIAVRLNYCTADSAHHATELADEVGRLIRGLAKSLSPEN
jgi:four helix bundle protein